MIAIVWMLASPAGSAALAPDFGSDARAALKVYQPILKANEALLSDGKCAEATKALLDAVPEAKRTAAHWFVLGNFLFEQDFALSYGLHKKAYELAPDESSVGLEWAIERHRKGEFAEAEPLYAKAIKSYGEKDPKLHAMRADCLLHLGKAADAVAEWKAADCRENHSEIEEGFSWIYNHPHPVVERAALLQKARTGDVAAVEELLLLDLDWETDLWNSRPKKEYVELDLSLAEKVLSKEPERLAALRFLARFTPADEIEDLSFQEKPADPALVAEATALGVLGEKRKLPANTRVAGSVIALLVQKKAATEAGLLAAFEPEYEKRVEAGDLKAIDTLAAFYEKTKSGKLAALEELGWTKHHDANCGAGLIGRMVLGVKSDDPQLARALELYPADERFTGMVVEIAMRERKGVEAALVRHLGAMVRKMSRAAPVDAAFGQLERELQKKPKGAGK